MILLMKQILKLFRRKPLVETTCDRLRERIGPVNLGHNVLICFNSSQYEFLVTGPMPRNEIPPSCYDACQDKFCVIDLYPFPVALEYAKTGNVRERFGELKDSSVVSHSTSMKDIGPRRWVWNAETHEWVEYLIVLGDDYKYVQMVFVQHYKQRLSL